MHARLPAIRAVFAHTTLCGLCHKDMFIHGPFNFQLAARNQRSRDRVSKDDWSALCNALFLYKNNAPKLLLRDMLLVHCTLYRDQEVVSRDATRALLAVPLLGPECYGTVPPPV